MAEAADFTAELEHSVKVMIESVRQIGAENGLLVAVKVLSPDFASRAANSRSLEQYSMVAAPASLL